MTISIVIFFLCAAALLVTAIVAQFFDKDATVTALFELTMRDRTMRVAILLLWWWIGWHFLGGQTLETPNPT